MDSYDDGALSDWSREDIPPARPIPSDAMPTALEGLLWGTLPLASSILAILLVFLIPDRVRVRSDVLLPFPAAPDEEAALMREARGMKRTLPIFITVVTAVLIVIAWFQSGGAERRQMRSASTPDQAVRLMLSEIQSHNFDAAYARLANRSDVDKNAFTREFAGSYGSLLTYASLENFDVWGLHSGDEEATVRAKLHYSTPVGPLDDIRDLKVEKAGDTWKVWWPMNARPQLPPQVIPVNYLRWDVIQRGAGDDWGVQNVDSPQVRIIS